MSDPRWQTVREALISYSEARAALDSLEAEMERLQGRLKASGVIDLMRRAEKAEAEMERLNKDWMAEADRAEKFVREMDDLRAEVERLREGIDLAVAMQNDRVEEIERLRTAHEQRMKDLVAERGRYLDACDEIRRLQARLVMHGDDGGVG